VEFKGLSCSPVKVMGCRSDSRVSLLDSPGRAPIAALKGLANGIAKIANPELRMIDEISIVLTQSSRQDRLYCQNHRKGSCSLQISDERTQLKC
jgi:hypothetical protein